MPPSAIVSVPVPRLPMLIPELLLQREPAPVTVTVPCEPAPSPMLADKAVISMTIPPFVIVSVPVPKLPILSPPPGPLFQAGARAGHSHRAGRAGRQSDGAAATAHASEPSAVLDGKRARAQAADHDGSGVRPAGACAGTVTVPRRPANCRSCPTESVNVPPFWIMSIPVPFCADGRDLWLMRPGP